MLLSTATALGLDPERRVVGLVQQVRDLVPARLVELELDPVDGGLGMVEARLAARLGGAREDLGERPPQRLAAERGREPRPLLVVEPRLRRGAVVVLERAAPLL